MKQLTMRRLLKGNVPSLLREENYFLHAEVRIYFKYSRAGQEILFQKLFEMNSTLFYKQDRKQKIPARVSCQPGLTLFSYMDIFVWIEDG